MVRNFVLVLETLEDRFLLSGTTTPRIAPVPLPTVQVTNLAMKVGDFLPGAVNKPVAEFSAKTIGRTYARLNEMLFIPAYGSEQLSQNVWQFLLKADLNGRSHDGCEATIGYGYSDWQTDVVDINLYRQVWIRPLYPLRLELTANFSRYMSGDTIGVELAQAVFSDLRGQPVPDYQVQYRGVEPVLHKMEFRMLSVSQQPTGNSSTAVSAGQKDVDLLEFYAWSNVEFSASVAFVATEGSLQNAENYRIVRKSFDGTPDYVVQGTLIDNKLVFDFGGSTWQGGSWKLLADIKSADQLPADPRLKLSFLSDSSGISATDLETGGLLRGFSLNGVGEGQIQLWAGDGYDGRG